MKRAPLLEGRNFIITTANRPKERKKEYRVIRIRRRKVRKKPFPLPFPPVNYEPSPQSHPKPPKESKHTIIKTQQMSPPTLPEAADPVPFLPFPPLFPLLPPPLRFRSSLVICTVATSGGGDVVVVVMDEISPVATAGGRALATMLVWSARSRRRFDWRIVS